MTAVAAGPDTDQSSGHNLVYIGLPGGLRDGGTALDFTKMAG